VPSNTSDITRGEHLRAGLHRTHHPLVHPGHPRRSHEARHDSALHGDNVGIVVEDRGQIEQRPGRTGDRQAVEPHDIGRQVGGLVHPKLGHPRVAPVGDRKHQPAVVVEAVEPPERARRLVADRAVETYG
jgi:hypothetical protein